MTDWKEVGKCINQLKRELQIKSGLLREKGVVYSLIKTSNRLKFEQNLDAIETTLNGSCEIHALIIHIIEGGRS
jgi:hypothetical protein